KPRGFAPKHRSWPGKAEDVALEARGLAHRATRARHTQRSAQPARALRFQKPRELGFDALMVESVALGQPSAGDHHREQALDADIAQRQAIHVDAVAATLTDARLPGGGGAASFGYRWDDRGDRRIETIGDLFQPAMALFPRDLTRGANNAR